MSQGNMQIGQTKKYDTHMRNAVARVIKTEWEKVKHQAPTGTEFAIHVMRVMNGLGYKAPDGSALTLRGVRYQVLRSGIVFRSTRANLTPVLEVVRESPRPQVKLIRDEPMPVSPKNEILESLSGIPKLLEAIITDTTVSPQQRVSLVKTYFGIEK